jgi:hypothetical protein
LIELIKPDYENWKPKDLENQKLMRIAHGFEKPDPTSTNNDDSGLDSIELGMDNLVNIFKFCIMHNYIADIIF